MKHFFFSLQWYLAVLGRASESLAISRVAKLGLVALASLLAATSGVAAAGLTWTIQNAGGTRPSLAFDSTGKPAIAYVDNGVQYSAFNGSTWSAAQSVDADGRRASLAFNPVTGKPQVAFIKAVTIDDFVAFATLNGTWTVEIVNPDVRPKDPSGRSPNLAISATGQPHIGWGGPDVGGNLDYSYSTKVNGTWNTDLVEGPGLPAFSGEWSSLALNSAGIPAIIYNAHTNAGTTYRGRYTIRTGGVWSPVEFAIVPFIVDGFPNAISAPGSALKFDASDVPHVAYVSWDGSIQYATRAGNGTWTSEPVATVGAGVSGGSSVDRFSLSLAIHPLTGVPYLAFRDNQNQNASLKVAYRIGGSWTVETVESGLGAFSTSTAIDAPGTTLGIAYDGKYAFTTLSTALTIATGGTLAGGTVGRPYTVTLQRINGTAAFTWSKFSGNYPANIALTAATGVLGGTPTVAANASFRLRVTDGTNGIAEKDFTLVVSAAPAITASATLTAATTSVPYAQPVSFTGGTAPLTWSKTGNLPDGITLDPAAGALAGTPTATGTFNFTVQLTDANGASASKALSIAVNDALAITTTSPLPDATVGAAYNQAIATVGGAAPLVRSRTGSLPAGINFSTASGLISGTATTAGTASFTIQVTDAGNVTVTREYALTVNPAPAVTTTALTEGTASLPYSYQATASGGTGTRNWTKTGNLPAGVNLSTTGLIAGTPTASGTFNVTLRVTDQNGAFAERALAMVVQAAPQGPSLALGQTLHAQRCVGCHTTASYPPRPGGSKLILDSKGNHYNNALALDDRSKTNLALYISSLDTQAYIINGVIKDAANQNLAGATVTATSGYLPTQSAVSGANGAYSITGLKPGDYVITASKAGVSFAPAKVPLAVTKDKYWLAGNIAPTPDVQPLVPTINFTGNQAPSVTLTNPVSGTAFLSPVTIPLAATASDPDGSVTKVEFFANGLLLATDTTAPFTYVWANAPVGTNLVTAVATDNFGVTNTSAALTVLVLEPILVAGVNPGNGAVIYATKCAVCHGTPPGRNPTWPGFGPPDQGVKGQNNHPGILASRSRYRDFDNVTEHKPPFSTIFNFFANVITESEKSDLSAYLAATVPERSTMFGTVRDSSGQPVAGAVVTISSLYNPGVVVTTGADGTYHVENLFRGDYNISATFDGLNPFYPAAYAFNSDPGATDPFITVDSLRTIGAPHSYLGPPVSMDFAPGHRVQGSVRNAGGHGFTGIFVRAGFAATAFTDNQGNFTLVLTNASYQLSIPTYPSFPYDRPPLFIAYGDYTFSPNTLGVTVAGTDQGGANFIVTTAPALTVSGKVTDPNGAAMSGVAVSLAEAPGINTTTDFNGDYQLTSPDPGTFTVTPTKALHLFSPATQVVTIGFGSRADVNFVGRTNSFYVTGTLRTRSLSSGPPFFDTIPGDPIPNAAVSVPGQTVFTDALGQYSLLLTNGTYTISVARAGYMFDANTQSVTVTSAGSSGHDFSGSLLVAYASLGGKNTNDGSSWASAKLSIQKAIDVTAFGGQVWVSGGVYFERISFGGISLYGLNKPTINAQPLPFGEQFTRGNAVKISTSIGVGTNRTRFDGFTVINGLATGSPNTGGGIHCTATDSEAGPVVIANNSIGYNVAGFKGGGIFLIGKATITNNVIMYNQALTGGGAGILCDFGSSLVTIANNLIAANTADSNGGGIGAYATSLIMANNTIVDNVATNSGAGGIYFGAGFGSTTNANNLIAYNSSGIGPANNFVLSRNNLLFGNTNGNYDGLAAGTGDLSLNPQFVDRAQVNYRLLSISPAINTGNNAFAVGPGDLDAAVRVEGATVDIGAYEYHGANVAPQVQLTSPVNGASFQAPAAFTLSAEASDVDGTVAKVEFYAGTALLGTVTTAPYTFSLNGLQAGTRELTAVATDNRGARTVSEIITVAVHPATDPVVHLISPLDDTRFAAPAQFTLQATATDSDGSVTNVEFFINGVSVGSKTAGPYTVPVANLAAGFYEIRVTARDNSGAATTSTPVQISVINPPQIQQSSTVYTGGEFRLPMMLETGKSYQIQASTNLKVWTALETFTAFGNAIEFIDTQAASYPGRFYRVVLLE